MAEPEKKTLKNKFAAIKSEFKKIIWPDKKELGKQTIVVLVSAICLGIVIAVVDMGLQYGFQFLMK